VSVSRDIRLWRDQRGWFLDEYRSRDPAGYPSLVDDDELLEVSGYLDEVRDGARDGLVKGEVELGAEVHRVRSPALDHGRGVGESITSDPGIDEVMRDRGMGLWIIGMMRWFLDLVFLFRNTRSKGSGGIRLSIPSPWDRSRIQGYPVMARGMKHPPLWLMG
jgi:hypothetical protein